MKRSINFSHLLGLSSACVKYLSKEPAIINKREADLVCDLVFAPDKKTGLPSSDISVYLASNTPIQVREFVKQNIFGEGLERVGGSSELEDADLHFLVRGSDETVEDYSSRVSSYMLNEREKVQQSFARLRNAKRQDT